MFDAILAGGLSGKGKIPYAILALMDVIRHHPGQVSVPLLFPAFALQVCCERHLNGFQPACLCCHAPRSQSLLLSLRIYRQVSLAFTLADGVVLGV